MPPAEMTTCRKKYFGLKCNSRFSDTKDLRNNQPSKTRRCDLQWCFCSLPPGLVCLYQCPPFGPPVLSVFGPRGSTSMHRWYNILNVPVIQRLLDDGGQDVSHVWGSVQSCTFGGYIFLGCCLEVQSVASPAPVWSERAESEKVLV